MAKGRKSHKRNHKSKTHKKHVRRTRKTRGGGWMETGKYVPGAPGYQIHQQYEGPGKDCPGVPVRPGYLTSDPAGTGGLPGLNSKLFGGATQLGSGGPVIGYVEPFRGEGGVAGAGRYGSATTTGAMQELKQMGGRYGFVPEVLNAKDGVVAIPAGFGRLPCEVGTKDPLNPNPNGIQTMSTAPGWVPGWTNYIKPFTGGKRKGKKTLKRKVRGGRVPEPTVTVGAVDMMRYYAPTAGYSNVPLNPAVQNNPGILAQIGYPAREFNQACIKTGGGTNVPTPLLPAVPAGRTGGKRKNRKVGGVNAEENAVVLENNVEEEEVVVPTEVEVEENNMNLMGGAYPVAEMAGKFVPVDIKDYAGGMLPVKFGGSKAITGGSFVASSPGLLNPTVGTLAGPAMGEQRIAITHNIPGATVYNGPVSKPVAGGKRKARSNKRKSNKK